MKKKKNNTWKHCIRVEMKPNCQSLKIKLSASFFFFFFYLLEHWNQIVNQLSYPLGQNCLTVNELYDQTARLPVTKNVMAKIVRTTANTV